MNCKNVMQSRGKLIIMTYAENMYAMQTYAYVQSQRLKV